MNATLEEGFRSMAATALSRDAAIASDPPWLDEYPLAEEALFLNDPASPPRCVSVSVSVSVSVI